MIDSRTNKGPFQQTARSAYDADLNRGLSLSGEDRDFFAAGRLAQLNLRLDARGAKLPTCILDFGCGTGETAVRMAKRWPSTLVVGVDTSESLLAVARMQVDVPSRCKFYTPASVPTDLRFDLVYCNGVFHHIPPANRFASLEWIKSRMLPAAWFALWENNSWNPGARWVMRRIPFDRDAVLLSPRQALRMLKGCGFIEMECDFAFIFPKFLQRLRPLERWLRKWPIGAQYQILCRTPLVAPAGGSMGTTAAAPDKPTSSDLCFLS